MPVALQGTLELRPAGGKGDSIKLPARLGAPVTANLPCNTRWEVTPELPNSWGPRTTIDAPADGSTRVILKVWPLGRIAGRVKLLEKGDKLPKLVSIVTLPPRTPAQRDVPKGALDCPVGPDGRWQCPPLPASTFDVVIAAEGYVPQYRWGLQVVAGKTADAGTVELKRGASVAAWVEVDGGPITESCTARLVPRVNPGTGAAISEKISRTAAEAHVRKDGFLQFVGVRPGTYRLEVQQPGFAAVAVEPVDVTARKESFLRDPITLKRPISLEVAVAPPADWLGQPWKVLVFKMPGGRTSFDQKTVFQGAADLQGVVTVADQSPGRYRAVVSDSLGNRFSVTTFRVTGPEDARQSITVDALFVRGTLRLGQDPLSATLWFGGRFGSSAVRMEADDQGKFQGVLPRGGSWAIDVDAIQPKFQTRARVEVESGDKGTSQLEIVLPANRLYGAVLADDGLPAAGALVSVSTADVDLAVTADELGRFDVRGLQPGIILAAASLSTGPGSGMSDRLTVFVTADQEVGPVEIHLKKARKLAASVWSVRGPVAGASVDVLPLTPGAYGGDAQRTDLDGTFTAEVPPAASAAAVVVSPPGYALTAFAVNPADAPRQLVVQSASGALELGLPERPEGAAAGDFSLWVFQQGLPIPLGALHRWLIAHGGEPPTTGRQLSFPELAPGTYRACIASRAVLAEWRDSGWTAPLASCASGQLAAGGKLRLDIPAP
jgi:hypothetical protein